MSVRIRMTAVTCKLGGGTGGPTKRSNIYYAYIYTCIWWVQKEPDID